MSYGLPPQGFNIRSEGESLADIVKNRRYEKISIDVIISIPILCRTNAITCDDAAGFINGIVSLNTKAADIIASIMQQNPYGIWTPDVVGAIFDSDMIAPDTVALIFDSSNINADTVASIINYMSSVKAAKVVDKMSRSRVADVFSSAALDVTKAKDVIDMMVADTSITNYDNIATAIDVSAVPADDIAAIFQNRIGTVGADRIASILASQYISTSRAVAILNSNNISTDNAASIIASNNITESRAAAILNSNNISTDRVASIIASDIITESRAAAILDDANMSASRVAAVLLNLNLPFTKSYNIFASMNRDFKGSGYTIYDNWSDTSLVYDTPSGAVVELDKPAQGYKRVYEQSDTFPYEPGFRAIPDGVLQTGRVLIKGEIGAYHGASGAYAAWRLTIFLPDKSEWVIIAINFANNGFGNGSYTNKVVIGLQINNDNTITMETGGLQVSVFSTFNPSRMIGNQVIVSINYRDAWAILYNQWSSMNADGVILR